MKTGSSRRQKDKPLATVKGPLKAEVYRSNFRPFESVKYLDRGALQKAASATVEVGMIEAAGVSATVAMEIENGMITRLKPVFSSRARGIKKPKISAKAAKKLQTDILRRIDEIGPPPLKLPTTVAKMDDIWEL